MAVVGILTPVLSARREASSNKRPGSFKSPFRQPLASYWPEAGGSEPRGNRVPREGVETNLRLTILITTRKAVDHGIAEEVARAAFYSALRCDRAG